MRNRRNNETTAEQQQDLSVSYNSGVGRIIGPIGYDTFSIPPEILKKRKLHWDNYFYKYSVECYNNTLESYIPQPIEKRLDLIQHWVDTGYFPYGKHIDKNMQLATGPTVSGDRLNLFHDIIKRKSNAQYIKPSCNNNSSSSSVDTTAYILSNMNTTNKADTMAIVEGAKNNTIANSQNVQSVEMTQGALRKKCGKSTENVVMDSNCNTHEQDLPEIYEQDSSEEENETQIQINSNANVGMDSLSKIINTDDEFEDNCQSYYTKLLDDKLTYTYDEVQHRNFYIKQNLLHNGLPYLKRDNVTEGFSPLKDSASKIRHRKKLYSGRESPIDLVKMKSSNKNVISKAKKNLHPALDIGYNVSRKYKRFVKKGIKKHRSFNKTSKTIMNSTTNSIPFTCKNNTKNSETDHHLAKYNNGQHSDMFSPINETENTINKFSKPTNELRRSNTKKANNVTNSNLTVIKSLTPVVNLTKLSKDDIEKYTRPSKAVKALSNLNMIQSPKLGKRKRRQRTKVVVDVSTRVTRSSKNNIQKCKSPSKLVTRLKPIVRLKRLSNSEIRKYKTSGNIVTDSNNLHSVILLKKESRCDIEKYKRINNRNELNKKSILPETIQLQNDDTSTDQDSIFKLSNIINLTNEDTTSDQSTVLMYECDNNLCTLSGGGSQTSLDQLKHDTGKKTLIHKNIGINKKLRSFRNENNPSNLRSSIINEDLSSEENVHECVPAFTVLSSGKSETVSKSSCNSSVHKNNKKKSRTLVLSDEDDEFVKLIHCPEDIQKSKLKQRYKKLSTVFNNQEEKLDTDKSDTSSINSFQRTRKGMKKSAGNRLHSEFVTENSTVEKQEKNINQRNLLAKRHTNHETRETQTIVTYKTKSLPNMNHMKYKRTLSLSNLCFKTKIFDFDSGSESVSQAMSQCPDEE